MEKLSSLSVDDGVGEKLGLYRGSMQSSKPLACSPTWNRIEERITLSSKINKEK